MYIKQASQINITSLPSILVLQASQANLWASTCMVHYPKEKLEHQVQVNRNTLFLEEHLTSKKMNIHLIMFIVVYGYKTNSMKYFMQ